MAGEQRMVPMLAYEDAAASIDWLCEAFGFEEKADQRFTDDDGTVTHAELRLDGSAIEGHRWMFGQHS